MSLPQMSLYKFLVSRIAVLILVSFVLTVLIALILVILIVLILVLILIILHFGIPLSIQIVIFQLQ